jgi:hypothetical protein
VGASSRRSNGVWGRIGWAKRGDKKERPVSRPFIRVCRGIFSPNLAALFAERYHLFINLSEELELAFINCRSLYVIIEHPCMKTGYHYFNVDLLWDRWPVQLGLIALLFGVIPLAMAIAAQG